MRIIEGFASAKTALSRQVGTDIRVSPSLKSRLKEMFGVGDPESAVKQIIADVRERGDVAVLDYTAEIDGIKLESLEVTKEQIKEAYEEVNGELVSALKIVAQRIHTFHVAQKGNLWRGVTKPGLGQLVRSLERVGVYVPGGTASYPSTVFMTAIPARVAGVNEIVLLSPPKSNGSIPALTLVAADIAQVDRVFAIGGAQAIAALAYGTDSVPKVDKICGPGNIFVMLAKKLVYGAVGIDGLEGPSEVVIVADETADAGYCASEILAQAEHDTLASAILITNSRRLADEVNQEVARQLQDLPRRNITNEAIEKNGFIAVVSSVDEAIETSNIYGPEHLCLMVKGAASYVEKVTNAGCIVTGKSATVAMSDYIVGPSHVLPTGGTSRFSSPLSVLDFIKFSNVISVDRMDLEQLGPYAAMIARAEGLEAHARAIEKRLE